MICVDGLPVFHVPCSEWFLICLSFYEEAAILNLLWTYVLSYTATLNVLSIQQLHKVQ